MKKWLYKSNEWYDAKEMENKIWLAMENVEERKYSNTKTFF